MSLQPPTSQGAATADEARVAGSWWVLLLICTGWFMVVLDESVVNVALPSIQAALGFTAGGVQWVANAYALACAGLLLLGGRVADVYGRKPVFVIGLAIFTGASLFGGLATTPTMLVVARALQGLGGAIVAPSSLTLLTTTFAEGPRRTRALTIWGAAGSVAGAAGNVLGGVLTQVVSWRAILLINVPVGLLVISLAIQYLSGHGRPAVRVRLDVAGAVLATVAVTSLTYAITRASSGTWDDAVTIAGLAVAVGSLAGFVIVEARWATEPLIPLRLLRRRAVSLGNTITLLAGACFQIPMWYFLSFALQKVLHYTPLQTGLAFLPYTILGLGIGMRVTPWLMRRIEHRTLMTIGALIIAVGFCWQSRIGPHSSYLFGVLGPAVVFTAGGMFFFIPLTSAVVSGVTEADAGAAAGLMNTAKQVGGVLGLAAIITTIGHTDTHTTAPIPYGHAFLAMAVLLALIAVLALALPRNHITRPVTRLLIDSGAVRPSCSS